MPPRKRNHQEIQKRVFRRSFLNNKKKFISKFFLVMKNPLKVQKLILIGIQINMKKKENNEDLEQQNLKRNSDELLQLT